MVTAAFDCVATLFGMNDDTKYSRVQRRIVGTAFGVAVVFWAVQAVVDIGEDMCYNLGMGSHREKPRMYMSERYAPNVLYYKDWQCGPGYIADSNGKKLIDNISWVVRPAEGGTVAVYSDGEHRGYFSLADGHIVAPPVYDHAWIFSEGLAGVEKNGTVQFIDESGRVVIDRSFASNSSTGNYVFHHGHCAIHDSTGCRMGMIDRTGRWVLPPVYDKVRLEDSLWIVAVADSQMVLDMSLECVIPMTQASFYVDDAVIRATFGDHRLGSYTLDGRPITRSAVSSVEQMVYNTPEMVYRSRGEYTSVSDEEVVESVLDEEPEARKAIATCLRYEADLGWYGLMSRDGKMLTPPAYTDIEAIGHDLYLCKTDYMHGVLIDSRGQIVCR